MTKSASQSHRKTVTPLRTALSATDQAYSAIKREILSNRLAAGEPIQVDRFVRTLKLSRTPVREAILRLEREGFIEVRPRMGTFVSHLDLQQIREMYEVRQTLEAMAARLAARHAPPDRLAALEESLLCLATEGDVNCRQLSEAGQEVHRVIVESCGNRVLAGMIASLQDHFTRFRSLSLTIPEKVLSSHREHLEIVRALRRGDAEGAEQAVRHHFQHAARYLLESLIDRPWDQGAPRVTVRAGR